MEAGLLVGYSTSESDADVDIGSFPTNRTASYTPWPSAVTATAAASLTTAHEAVVEADAPPANSNEILSGVGSIHSQPTGQISGEVSSPAEPLSQAKCRREPTLNECLPAAAAVPADKASPGTVPPTAKRAPSQGVMTDSTRIDATLDVRQGQEPLGLAAKSAAPGKSAAGRRTPDSDGGSSSSSSSSSDSSSSDSSSGDSESDSEVLKEGGAAGSTKLPSKRSPNLLPSDAAISPSAVPLSMPKDPPVAGDAPKKGVNVQKTTTPQGAQSGEGDAVNATVAPPMGVATATATVGASALACTLPMTSVLLLPCCMIDAVVVIRYQRDIKNQTHIPGTY